MAVPPNLRTDWVDNTGQLLTADALNSLGAAGNNALVTLNVKASPYFAVGNGSVDDSGALNAAITAAMNS